MNTIERIEARIAADKNPEPGCHITAVEWAAIKAVVEALEVAQAYVDDAAEFPEQFKPGLVKKHSNMVREALSKLEGE